ncbi:hypothetical protein J31TS4_15970 [Paenibacillus sp. J31TS4]|uniref:P27 family phage terminase small subunit n=1 Tax=Paenibacillus sp. J31TS4 TaxID=2807195 RepID=UPI001B182AA1|nr:P27 family phage terminase small subunit [Paenibacillus sp. J31TS4]GIP38317.1 hypothetical protein J31TS4_15970 [Paenibacillus sp. J31TS4]
MSKAGEKALAAQQLVIDRTVSDMKALGVYKPEYDPLIKVYAELVVQYNMITERFVNGGMRYQVSTADGGAKKAPIVATLESLRKDLLAYSDRLCLNPKSLETVTVEKKGKSALAAALSEMG